MPANVRPEVVHELVAAAFEGMANIAERTTADEVISACMTVALRAVEICQNKEVCREGVEKLWSLLPEQKKVM